MLLHLVPRLFACRVNEPECALIDFHCPALGLKLRNGIELVARRPYPNKHYLVACRKLGQKAMNGFLVETTERVREFTTLTRWAVGADRIVNHQVQYFVLDEMTSWTPSPTICRFGMQRRRASAVSPAAGPSWPTIGHRPPHSRAWSWSVATVQAITPTASMTLAA